LKISHLLVAASIACSVLPAVAQRTPVPIIDHPNVRVEKLGGASATAAQVRQAILAAASATGRKWVISEPTPGLLIATYHVRSHTVVTEIRYAANQFSVAYKDSVNMKYSPGGDGRGVIHPFYNQWVQDFVQAIRLELNRA
jgi:hypothetical protein